MNNLTPTQVVDKNGKLTTVYKKLFGLFDNKKNRSEKALKSPPPQPKPPAPDSIILNGRTWKVAPEGKSGNQCRKCGEFDEERTSESFSRTHPCAYCGTEFETYEAYYSGVQVGIKYDSLPFIDEGVTRETTWYHITTNPNWHEDIYNHSDEMLPYIHAGTESAAKARMQTIRAMNDMDGKESGEVGLHPLTAWGKEAEYFIYELSIKPKAKISNSIVPDEDYLVARNLSEEGAGYFKDEYENGGITRYVSGYEDVGSISLMMHVTSFDIVKRTKL